MRKILILLAAIVLFLAITSCRNVRTEANMAEAMSQLETQLVSMQQDYAILQSEIDSLRNVVARQDTVISRMSQQIANMPIPQH